MSDGMGLRERKKLQTRRLLAETAARLFAEHGYDEVSMADVGRAAEVSDQTVYNYFPAKQDLVLDMADELRQRYTRAVAERPAGVSPAAALEPLALELVIVLRESDPILSRGEFPALSASSVSIRRFALQMREQQVHAIAGAIRDTAPQVPAVVAGTHAAALVAVFQAIDDRLGRVALTAEDPSVAADELERDVRLAIADLDEHFHAISVASRWSSK